MIREVGKSAWKITKSVFLIIIGILLNYGGKWAATSLHLPLWLDTIGTCLVACILGPVEGAICGVANSYIYGIEGSFSYSYAIVSVMIGLILGICMKRGVFDRVFDALTLGVGLGIASAVVSSVINITTRSGMIGNVWGDGLYGMLLASNWNSIIASVLGELFIDFPDKVLVVLYIYAIVHIRYRGKKAVVNLCLLTLLTTLVCPILPTKVQAAEEEKDMLAKTVNYAQTIYNSENGLSAGEANAIVETPDGYIWIGTYAGLYRYDGRNFYLMNFESVKNVNRLFVDDKGRLFIGTNDNGVSVYENGKITMVLDKSNGLSSNSIRCIACDSLGNYYIGTSASLSVARVDSSIQVMKTYSYITYASDIAVNDDDTVSIVTNAGKFILMNDMRLLGMFDCEVPGDRYTSSAFDHNGRLYLGTSSNKVYPWDMEKKKIEEENVIETDTLAYIHSLQEDDEGRMWICTDYGIGYIKDNKFTKVNTYEFASSIDNMMKDYQGNYWFTSSRFGVLKLTNNSFCDIYDQCNLEDKVVNSVTLWNGLLYSGTDTGLDVIDVKTMQPVQNALTEYLATNRIRCLKVDSNNHLWIATSAGLGLLEVLPDEKMTIITYNPDYGTVDNRFRSVLELKDGTIVAAENTGMDFIKDGKVIKTLTVDSGLSNPQILSMIEKKDGTLLAGSDGDGIMVIRDGEVIGKITEQNGLPSGVILRIIKMEEGFLVVTSNSLCFMNERNEVTELKNFPYPNNYDVIRTENSKLWVLGSAGIYIVDMNDLLSGKAITYELLNGKKGLNASITANSWNYENNHILFLSTNAGIYSINLVDYNAYQGEYRMMVDYIDLDDDTTPVSQNEHVENLIPSKVSRIRIHPEILNYTLNEPYIRYYLEGFDKEEYVVSQTQLSDVVYTNLPYGTYTFHMSLMNRAKGEVISQRSYTFVKQPQFWEHSWFRIYLAFVCIMAVAYITWLFTTLHTRKIITTQKQELEMARQQAEMGNQTILAIAKTVDAKDLNTSEHSERVAEYAVMIAKKLGWSEEKCDNLRQIALLHDIGKIGIPDAILNKPARLTEEEYAIMKSHVLIGAKILKDFTLVDHVEDGVKYHHERYDGKGYTEGLKGEEIPADGRIIGIADAFDAMTANRVYRKGMDKEYVISELKKGRGTQFDPHMIDIMMELIENGSIHVWDKK